MARLRQTQPGVPAIVMPGTPRERGIVGHLHAAADDCLTKPVRGPGMPARVEAMLRRAGVRRPHNRSRETFGDDAFDPGRSAAVFRGRIAMLTPKEFRFAPLLFANRSWPVSRVHIPDRVCFAATSGRAPSIPTRHGPATTRTCAPGHGDSLMALYGYGYQLNQVSPAQTDIGQNCSPVSATANERLSEPL